MFRLGINAIVVLNKKSITDDLKIVVDQPKLKVMM